MSKKIKSTKVKAALPVEVWYTMSQTAKLIGKMGRNKLYGFLRNEDVLMHHNEPYQKYCDQGYFKLQEVRKRNSKRGLVMHFPVLFVSPKGVDFIERLIRKKEDEGFYSE